MAGGSIFAGAALRVAALAGTFRRAGFAFDKEPTPIDPDAITVAQLLTLTHEPRLVVEANDGDGTWRRLPPEFAAVLNSIGAVQDFTVDAVMQKLRTGELRVDPDVVAAMRAGFDQAPASTEGGGNGDSDADALRSQLAEEKAKLAEAGRLWDELAKTAAEHRDANRTLTARVAELEAEIATLKAAAEKNAKGGSAAPKAKSPAKAAEPPAAEG